MPCQLAPPTLSLQSSVPLDWGYHNVGFRDNSSDLLTPNLDGMLRDSLLLENAYSYFWCTPSRSSFLSGRLPMNVYQDSALSVSSWDYAHPLTAGLGIPRNMTTLPYYLSKAGYQTAMVGK